MKNRLICIKDQCPEYFESDGRKSCSYCGNVKDSICKIDVFVQIKHDEFGYVESLSERVRDNQK